jgi:hypothetical protein
LAALLERARQARERLSTGTVPVWLEINHRIRLIGHAARLTRVSRLTAIGALARLARLGRAFLQPVRGRRLAGVAAGLLALAFEFFNTSLQVAKPVEERHDQRILLRMAHAVEFGLDGTV